MPYYTSQSIRFVIAGVLFATGLFWIFSTFMFVRIQGYSMSPTLKDGQWVLVQRGTNSIRPGDIAVFNNPVDDLMTIKRCIVKGPDILDIQHGWLNTSQGRWYVNGKQWKHLDSFISEGDHFMIGDNHFYSNDSRNYGSISRNRIIGRVAWIFPAGTHD